MTPVEADTVAGLRGLLSGRDPCGPLGLVPTMGALHRGHAALIRRARRECHTVVVSIFVNPLQFGPHEDFDRYPRPVEKDRRLCAELGVDFIFAPPVAEMHPGPPLIRVTVDSLGEHLCGRRRPGHFEGVATVVAVLLNIVQPDRAYFGRKDAQQLAIVRRLVKDLKFGVQICSVETVREADGLAVSSRNRYLNEQQRAVAPALHQSLLAVRGRLEKGETDTARLRAVGRAGLEAVAGLRVDYLEIVDAESLQPVEEVAGPVLVAAAVELGPTRLIDNLSWAGPSEAEAARS